MISLQARALSRTLAVGTGQIQALNDFSADFEASRRYAITGPSGCGKSTLLYLLGLLDKPSAGEIFLQGKPTAALSGTEMSLLRNRSLGFVFQFHLLLSELTVEENILLPAMKAGVAPELARQRAGELLRLIGLSEKASRLAHQLSGGEQQRVAVARSLVNNPAVVLADEPTGNLDSRNSEMVFELLGESCRARGATLIVVTHNPELAKRCDEVLHLVDGRRV